MSEVVERLEKRYPGIRVASPIEAYALLGEFDLGVEAFARLSSPSSDDHRWLGVCHFSEFRDNDAIDAYRRAIDAGCQAARINLAHSLAFVDRADEINEQLEQVNFDQLSLYDRVFYLRVKSQNDERNGELQVALRQAEYAWRIVQGAPEFPLLAPHLLNQLGILHGRIGRSQRALWYLDRNLELTAGEENTAVHLTRIRVLSSLGRLEQARAEFEALRSVPAQYEAILRIRSAEILWAEGRIADAAAAYEDAARRAKEQHQSFEEFQASLELGALRAKFGTGAIDETMRRAQDLISDRSDRLMYRFREILIALWRGSYSPQHAADELSALSSDLNTMGLLQEQGWVDAHAAHCLNDVGETEKAQAILDSLVALAATLQNAAFLAREWYLMASFRDTVRMSHPTIAGSVRLAQGSAGHLPSE